MKKYFFLSIFLFTLSFPFNINAELWSNPKATPPGDNISTPINVSNVAQTKVGGLTLNSAGATYGLLVPFGKVGIGTLTPGGLFDVFGSSGVAFTVLSSGKVGIGTASPASRLSVLGGVQVGDDTEACTVAKYGTMKWSNQSGTYRLEVCGSTTSGGVTGPGWIAVAGSGGTGGSGSGTVPVGQAMGYAEAIQGSKYEPYPIGSSGVYDCQGINVPAWCEYDKANIVGNTVGDGGIWYGCGTGYTVVNKKNFQIQYEYDYMSTVTHFIIVCSRNTASIGASCSAVAGCPSNVDGAQCSSFTRQYSADAAVGNPDYQYPRCSSFRTISTCTNGTWSPTPAVSPTCTYGPPPAPPACNESSPDWPDC
ncbi:MAG: hypothetical protein AAB484_02460 [Patescibacteria group bacterium]